MLLDYLYSMENLTAIPASQNAGLPNATEIVLPPVLFILIILICMLILSIVTQPRWWQRRCFQTSKKGKDTSAKLNQSSTKHHSQVAQNGYMPQFLSDADSDIVNRMAEFQNNPVSLFCVGIPAFASLAVCPLAIWMYITWGGFFWPSHSDRRMPDINDAIANFLMPAGLVYAIAFGFAYQDVLANNTVMEKGLEDQTVLLRQTWQLVKCASPIPQKDKRLIGRALKDAVVQWMACLLKGKQMKKEETLWDAVQLLSKLQLDKSAIRKTLDESIVIKIFDNLIQLEKSLNNWCQKGHRSINFLQWLFLELLGFISFFGILMVKAGSYRLELTMCILTVFSITAFSYILADLDSSYHGVFRICLLPSINFIDMLSADFCSFSTEMCDQNRHSGNGISIVLCNDN